MKAAALPIIVLEGDVVPVIHVQRLPTEMNGEAFLRARVTVTTTRSGCQASQLDVTQASQLGPFSRQALHLVGFNSTKKMVGFNFSILAHDPYFMALDDTRVPVTIVLPLRESARRPMF